MFEETKEPQLLLPEKAMSTFGDGYDPAAEIRKTAEIVTEGGIPPVDAAGETAGAVGALEGPDSAFQAGDVIYGKRFDPAIHKTHPNGQPVLGSKKQLLLKREHKKSARQKLADGVNKILGRNEEIPGGAEIPETAEFREVPLSDHEFDAQEAEKDAERGPEPKTTAEISEARRKLTRSAEKSANGIVFFSGLGLGPEIHRQKKSDEYRNLVDACEDWEADTGHRFDLHPNIAFPLAVFAALSGMARNEPACKARLDAATVMVRQNVLGALGEKFPILKAFMGGGAPVPGDGQGEGA